jgi:cation:H+ antiporter
MDWVLLVLSLVVILGGAELFTNGVEWVGQSFGLSEGAIGSVLAAAGTALPETILPLIAILLGSEAGKEIGVGAILGAPLMLSTLALVVLGATVMGFAATGRRERPIRADIGVPLLDLLTFLLLFIPAIIAGVVRVKAIDYALAAMLVVAYGFYVRRHFGRGTTTSDRDMAQAIPRMYLSKLRGAGNRDRDPAPWAAMVQTGLGLLVIVVGARVFVDAVSSIADQLHVSKLAFALLVAPVATELPETFNAGFIWGRRSKDTLAVGNITGAMVFQAVFPVAIGLVLTPWRLSGDSLVAALAAASAAALLYVSLLIRRRLTAPLLLLQGAFYVGYVVYVLSRI